MEIKSIIVLPEDEGMRIDLFLAKRFSDFSRSYFQRLIVQNEVTINSETVKPSQILQSNDQIQINFREVVADSEPMGEDIPLEIIYEDKEVVVINKQPGIVVHPAAGNPSGTLVNALIKHFPAISNSVIDKKNTISRQRPGLVHRLDKDTSGVLIVAKTPRSMHSLSRQISNRTAKKIYWAICYGWPKAENGEIVSYLGRDPKNRKLIANIGPERGREAISCFNVIKCFTDKTGNKVSLVEFNIKTGRTHQIRVQAMGMGTPVLGDMTYGSKPSIQLSHKLHIQRQMLHAKTLAICLPGDSQPTEFEAKLPTDFEIILKKLKLKDCSQSHT